MNDNITLLDYFAAHAMQGLVSREDIDCIDNEIKVKAAYTIADAMIKEHDERLSEKAIEKEIEEKEIEEKEIEEKEIEEKEMYQFVSSLKFKGIVRKDAKKSLPPRPPEEGEGDEDGILQKGF